MWNCCFTSWLTKEVEPEGDPSEMEILFPLKPFTQYAIYVQTYMVTSASQGGMSPIEYFTTKPDGMCCEISIIRKTPDPQA